MNKIISLLAFSILLLVSVSPNAFAQVFLIPFNVVPSGNPIVGGTIDIELSLDAPSPVPAISGTITWDGPDGLTSDDFFILEGDSKTFSRTFGFAGTNTVDIVATVCSSAVDPNSCDGDQFFPSLVFEVIDNTDDVDLDGIPNSSDNCPEDANPSQTDSDNDGLGNACDPFDGTVCGPGTTADNELQLCIGTSSGFDCGPKTEPIAGICVPILDEICGSGTMIQNMVCVAQSMGSMIGGELLEINTVSLLVGAIGVNPVITGLVGITIAGIAGQAVLFVNRRKKFENS